MTRIAALFVVALVGAVVAEQQSAKMVMPATSQYQVVEQDLTTAYKATLDTVNELYRELGMDEQTNEASSYRSQPDKARAALNLALRRMAGEELSADEVNEVYSNSYRFKVADLVNGANIQTALELTGQLKDVKEQVGTALTALKEIKHNAVGLGKNVFAMARLMPDSFSKVKTLVYKAHKIYKTVTSGKGIAPLIARLASMSKKPTAEEQQDPNTVAAEPAVVDEAVAVAANATTVNAVPAEPVVDLTTIASMSNLTETSSPSPASKSK